MKIVIYCDPDHVRHPSLHAAVSRAIVRSTDDETVGIHVQDVEPSGFQTIMIVFRANEAGHYVVGRSLTVGQVQRHMDAELEYHS